MAEFYQTQEELEKLFGDLLKEKTKLPDKKVIARYAPLGVPAVKKGDNILYFSLSPVDSPISQFKNRSDSTNNLMIRRSSQYTRELMLNIILYGDKGSDIITKLLHCFSEQSTKEYLKKNKLTYIPDKPRGPYRLPESHNGQWFERCELTLYFYSVVSLDEQLNTFSKAIIVYKEGK